MSEEYEIPEPVGPDEVTPEYVKAVAWNSMHMVSQDLIDNELSDLSVHELDQRIADWKNNMMMGGIDMEDERELWILAIGVERTLSLIAQECMHCPGGPHMLEHVRASTANLIVTLSSAMRTHVSPPTG